MIDALTVYSYHPQTGAFQGAELAPPSPEEPGKFIEPAYCTRLAPPAARPGEVAVFRDGAWVLKDTEAPPVAKRSWRLKTAVALMRGSAAVAVRLAPELTSLRFPKQ